MEILRICLDEVLLIRYFVITHLILRKIQNMMDMNLELLQLFIIFWIKILWVVLLTTKLFRTRKNGHM